MSVREEILTRGLVDWVDLSQVHWYVAQENPSAPLSDVQDTTLEVIRSLVNDGLVELGDVSGKGGHFVEWNTPIEVSIQRIRDVYVTHFDNRALWIALCWLNLTEKGEHVARRLDAKCEDSQD